METIRLTVPSHLSAHRLDRVLAALRPELSRSRAAKLAKNGCVLLDGVPVKPSAPVKAGQVLTVTLLPSPSPSMAAQ